MCMFGNVAVMEQDKTPSLRPGPSHTARKLLGCVVTSQKEVSPGRSGTSYRAASTTRISNSAAIGGVELYERSFLLFLNIFSSNCSKSLLQNSFALLCPASLNANSPSLLSLPLYTRASK